MVVAQTTPKSALLALSKQDHTLSIIEPQTLHIVAQIPVGNDPHEVVASSDGRTAYVSNYGFGAFHTLAVIDLVGQKPLPQVELGALRGPHGLMFAEGKVWFTAEAAKAIGSYDPASGGVDSIMGTGQNRTHMLYVQPGAKSIVTTSSGSIRTFNARTFISRRVYNPPIVLLIGAPDHTSSDHGLLTNAGSVVEAARR